MKRGKGRQAVGSRHPQVHHRHVGAVEPVQREGLVAALGLRADLDVRLEAEHVGQPYPDEVVVVDEHHSNAGHGGRSLAASEAIRVGARCSPYASRSGARNARLRPYADADWEAVLEICLLAFAPAYESLERLPGSGSLAHVDADWRASIGRYLRSLTRSGEAGRLLVAVMRGSVVGVVHYDVDADAQSGSIGVSAVHPSRQAKGIGTSMYQHVLEAMRARGVKYVTADTEGDASHATARRVYEKLGFVAVPMVHYFKRLTPEPPDTGRKRRAAGHERRSARSARSRNSSGIPGGRKRR